MIPTPVVILDEGPGREIGSQLNAVLLADGRYRVAFVDQLLEVKEPARGDTQSLVLPVLPNSRTRARELLADLQAIRPDTLFLPVAPSEILDELLDDLLLLSRDFLVAPLRDSEIRTRVARSLRTTTDQRNPSTDDRVNEECGLAQLVGEERSLVELKRKIPLVAQFESTVLLIGETGTGKERCARALHYLSRRAGKPFLPVNCGAIPVDLFENELYGHEKGAFTGALAAQPGLIAEADGGTLFLDEVEALSLACQVKLLRFLQDQTYYTIGSAKPKRADVWIVASTNVDLLQKAKEATFREDLFYRLAVITLALPPLRQRKGDIPLLAAHFLRVYGRKHGRRELRFSTRAIELLCRYSWPGNVRELENVVQQVIVFAESETIEPEHLPILQADSPTGSSNSFKQMKAQAVQEFERNYIVDLLRKHNGNVTRAARAANKERRALGRLIKKYQIEKHGRFSCAG